MAPLLGGNWLEGDERPRKSLLDARDDIVVELIPGSRGATGNPDLEERR
jgi:hypothetical protein